MPCGATQDRQVMVERSDKMWSTGEGNSNPLQYSCLQNPMNNTKRQNDRILKEEFPRSVGAQYATGDQWRNNSRKNDGMEPKQKQYQLWMWLVIEARPNAVKSNIAQESVMLDPWIKANSVQFNSVAQSCLTLCNPMNRSTPGLPVHHQLLEFTKSHVHWVGDAIQPSHPLSSPSPPAPNPSQPQVFFQCVNSSH